MNIPNPGSVEAYNQGCTCPVLDNEYGIGIGNGEFVISENCSIHNIKEEPKTNITIDAFAKAIKKYGHTQKQVAIHLGISDSSLSRILQYKQKNLAQTLIKEIREYTNYGGTMEFKTEKVESKMNDFTLRKKIKARIKGQMKTIGYLVAKLVQIGNNSDSPYLVSVGMSICNTEHDKFNKKLAYEIALGRADNHNKKYQFKDKCLYYNEYYGEYIYLNDEVSSFLGRCMKYYKDKSIIFPKFIFV